MADLLFVTSLGFMTIDIPVWHWPEYFEYYEKYKDVLNENELYLPLILPLNSHAETSRLPAYAFSAFKVISLDSNRELCLLLQSQRRERIRCFFESGK